MKSSIKTDCKAGMKIALVGNPNVGKSVTFKLLTGKFVMVSNYPGTTVEVTRGRASFGGGKFEVIDTPGTNNLIPASEDELVARDIVLKEDLHSVIQVADAKNLRRGLFISIQLAEAGVPFVLDLNMLDEASTRGIVVDTRRLEEILGVTIVPTVATCGKGIKDLIRSIDSCRTSNLSITYDETLEKAINEIAPLVPETSMSKRSIAIMLLAGDEELEKYLSDRMSAETLTRLRAMCKSIRDEYGMPLSQVINQWRLKKVDEIIAEVVNAETSKPDSIAASLGNISVHPFWGFMLLFIVLYATYQIVGVFAAGTCVDFLETTVFGEYINPAVTWAVNKIVPFELAREALVGEFGMLTMALSYALAIVLPIVTFFFIIFGLLEDSGYLPRMAFLLNRMFKLIGLNGKAVLPMILGLGCATMATITARIMPTRKDRIIITLLLALAVPCSAQLGVIFGGTATISGTATLIWLGSLVLVIMLVGYSAAKVLPGAGSDLILEIPPVRIPKIGGILVKTLARLEWYLKEAVPLFMIGTFILFLLSKTGMLGVIEDICAPVVVNVLGLPKSAAAAFIMGFLRRDYGAILLIKDHNLDSIQLIVSLVTITLFVPCVANVFVMIKERGFKTASLIVGFIFAFAFMFGGLLNFILRALEVKL